jgi:hypothetical protein
MNTWGNGPIMFVHWWYIVFFFHLKSKYIFSFNNNSVFNFLWILWVTEFSIQSQTKVHMSDHSQVKKEHNIPSMDKHYRPITSGIHAYISPISLLILTISLLTVRSKEKCLTITTLSSTFFGYSESLSSVFRVKLKYIWVIILCEP